MAPNPRRVRGRLESEVYARIPKMACRGLCEVCCVGDIDPMPVERQAMERAAGRPLAPRPDGQCGYLSAGGRCGVYEDRPLICRAWGAVETMPCPHGCLVEGERVLTFEEFYELQAAAFDVTGDTGAARAIREGIANPKVRDQMEFLARRGQEVSFPCACGGRVRGEIGKVMRCGGCGGTYAVTP